MLSARFPFRRPNPVLILAFVATTGMGAGLLFSLLSPEPAKCAYTKASFFWLGVLRFWFLFGRHVWRCQFPDLLEDVCRWKPIVFLVVGSKD
jgi:hypothetical protein